MKGIAKVRKQGAAEPILRRMLEERGLKEPPLWKSRPPETMARRKVWLELGKYRDGPVNPVSKEITDINSNTESLKKMALDLGATIVGCARLTPIMISEKSELPHDYIFCIVIAEDYGVVEGGPRAIETESTGVYVKCAEISTKLAEHIRDMGYPAMAHHNGGDDIMALPALYAAGVGELGRHGSLINPELGASFRPGFVTTTMPLALDTPLHFGVQDTCMSCNLCHNNCPPEAIPKADDYEVTEGVKRWVTDVEKCYTVSRMREQYCHICVDVCPYVHRANGDSRKKALYKHYMALRKKAGYRTPAWFPEDPPDVLKDNY